MTVMLLLWLHNALSRWLRCSDDNCACWAAARRHTQETVGEWLEPQERYE